MEEVYLLQVCKFQHSLQSLPWNKKFYVLERGNNNNVCQMIQHNKRGKKEAFDWAKDLLTFGVILAKYHTILEQFNWFRKLHDPRNTHKHYIIINQSDKFRINRTRPTD